MNALTLLTVIHTLLSIIAILVGILAAAGMFGNGRSPRVRRQFLLLAAITSITGFLFPFNGVTPAIVTGVIALAVLAVMLLADRAYGLQGIWRPVYALGMVLSLYLLVFVAIVQAFLKLNFLNRLAPTQTEPPFVITQAITLLLFIVLGVVSAMRFKPAPVAQGI